MTTKMVCVIAALQHWKGLSLVVRTLRDYRVTCLKQSPRGIPPGTASNPRYRLRPVACTVAESKEEV